MQGRVKPPPVRGVCGYSYLGVSCVGSWLSRGDSILLFVPCGPGSVRGCDSVSAILLCYVAFVLVPVDRHRWAHFFWLVAGTNARGCSFGCVYASWVDHFWSLFLVLFCFYVFFLIRESLLYFITTHSTQASYTQRKIFIKSPKLVAQPWSIALFDHNRRCYQRGTRPDQRTLKYVPEQTKGGTYTPHGQFFIFILSYFFYLLSEIAYDFLVKPVWFLTSSQRIS